MISIPDNWTTSETGIQEWRPSNTVRYFLVPDGEQWVACISTGMAYKVIRQLTPEGDTLDFAKSRCRRDWLANYEFPDGPDASEGTPDFRGYCVNLFEGSVWLTQGGEITRNYTERGIWPTFDEAEAALRKAMA